MCGHAGKSKALKELCIIEFEPHQNEQKRLIIIQRYHPMQRANILIDLKLWFRKKPDKLTFDWNALATFNLKKILILAQQMIYEDSSMVPAYELQEPI